MSRLHLKSSISAGSKANKSLYIIDPLASKYDLETFYFGKWPLRREHPLM